MPDPTPHSAPFRAVARIIDKPLGVGIEWLDGIDYLTDPTLNDGTVLYVKDADVVS